MSDDKGKAAFAKCEEHLCAVYSAAATQADKLFAPFGEKDASGSRTCPEAKVRIRRRSDGSFRVILYKQVVPEKKKEPAKEEEGVEERKQHTRHRRDRKGRRRNKREHAARTTSA